MKLFPFIFLLVLFAPSHRLQDFEEEFLDAVAKLENDYENIEIIGRHRIFDLSTNQPRKTVRTRYVSRSGKRKLEMLDETGGVLRLSVVSEELSFSVIRESVVDEFAFLEIGEGKSTRASVLNQIETNSNGARAAFALSGTSAKQLVEKMNTKRWESSSTADQSTIEFVGQTKVWKAKDGDHYNTVNLKFRKGRGFTLEVFDVRGAESDKVVASSEIERVYSTGSDSPPLLQMVKSTSRDAKGEVDAYSEFEVEKIELGKVNDSEFTLDGNNLKSKISDSVSTVTPFRIALGLFLVSIFCLILGYSINNRKQVQ